jgi:hypothetical protein
MIPITGIRTLRQKREYIRKALQPILNKQKATNYKYSKLDDVVAHLQPVLDKYEVGFEHSIFIENGVNCLKTTIYDLDNETDEVTATSIVSAESKVMSVHQATGAGITFFKRYHLVTLFGLLTENDTDGNTTVAPKSNNQLDWIAIFEPYIKKGDKTDCLKKYETQVKNMSDEQKKVIMLKIDAMK